jgi:ribokinase
MSTPDFSGRKDNPVVVIGSLNMDLVMRTPRVPVGGETLHGHEFSTLPGGKGANQAVACARLGAKVAMIGQVGNDGFGTTLRDGLAADGIDTSGVLQTSAVGTGVAMILVEDIGQNRIVLAAGANGALTPADIDAHAARIGGAAMLVLQLEVPMPVVQRAIGIAHAAGVPVLLNPGPASPLPEAVWSQIDILVPNESEATLLSGVEVSDATSAYAAAKVFRQRGVKCVLITLGANGVAVSDDAGERHLPAHVVKAVDTTAAGDTFIGGLSAGLVEGLAMDDAVALGQRASALCVTRHGAQPSIPYRREIA